MDSFDSSAVKYHPEKADIYRPEETIAGFTSVSLSRGRTAGYGLYFSRTRIIGVRKRRTSLVFGLALTLPLLVLLLYLNFLLGLSGPPYATFCCSSFLYSLIRPYVDYVVSFPSEL